MCHILNIRKYQSFTHKEKRLKTRAHYSKPTWLTASNHGKIWIKKKQPHPEYWRDKMKLSLEAIINTSNFSGDVTFTMIVSDVDQ